MTAKGLSWKGYMEDMGSPCRHPALNTPDTTQKAKVGDQYAARHNPFVYFAGITSSPDCAQRDVDLTALPGDLAQVSTTPNLSYITPNLCDDGHDAPCVDGRPGGLASADAWLRTWVPKITASPAFKQDGTLIITFDESDGPQSDATACSVKGPAPTPPCPDHRTRRRTRRRARPAPHRPPQRRRRHARQPLLAAGRPGGHLGLPRLGYATNATPLALSPRHPVALTLRPRGPGTITVALQGCHPPTA